MRSFILITLASSWLLAACGQKGPLYLPTSPAPASVTRGGLESGTQEGRQSTPDAAHGTVGTGTGHVQDGDAATAPAQEADITTRDTGPQGSDDQMDAQP